MVRTITLTPSILCEVSLMERDAPGDKSFPGSKDFSSLFANMKVCIVPRVGRNGVE